MVGGLYETLFFEDEMIFRKMVGMVRGVLGFCACFVLSEMRIVGRFGTMGIGDVGGAGRLRRRKVGRFGTMGIGDVGGCRAFET